MEEAKKSLKDVQSMKDMRDSLDSYYFCFDATGNEAIDDVLKAVAFAGKHSHSTDEWGDEIFGCSFSCTDLIKHIARLSADRLSKDPTP